MATSRNGSIQMCTLKAEAAHTGLYVCSNRFIEACQCIPCILRGTPLHMKLFRISIGMHT